MAGASHGLLAKPGGGKGESVPGEAVPRLRFRARPSRGSFWVQETGHPLEGPCTPPPSGFGGGDGNPRLRGSIAPCGRGGRCSDLCAPPPHPAPPGVPWIMGSGVRLECLLTPTPPSWDPVPASGNVWQGQRAACVVGQRHPAGDRDPRLLSRQPGPRSPSLSFWARRGAPQEASCPAVRRFFPSCVFRNCPVCLGITGPHACSPRATKGPA